MKVLSFGGKDQGGLVSHVFKFIGNVGFIGGLVQLVTEGSKPAPPRLRALAAVGFLVSGLVDAYASWTKSRKRATTIERSITISVPLGLLLAFDRATPHYHHARPWWLAALAFITVICLVGAIALTVYLLRRNEDERQRAIVNTSMAVAFLATLGVVVIFALLQSSGVGPTLQPSYVLITAAGSWFAAFFVLRARM